MDVRHEPDAERYTLMEGDSLKGLIDYHISGNTINLHHTEIDPGSRGGGLGGTLVSGTLDLIREGTEYRVNPSCPFVARYIDSHPEYADLLTR